MFLAVLILHSWLRWLILITGVLATARAIRGWRAGAFAADPAAGRWFVIALDLQFVLGGLLYALFSPTTRVALKDMGGAMQSGALRFWAVEHPLLMVVALVLAHVGRVRARRAAGPRDQRMVAVFFGLALLLVLLGVPWPWTQNARPLLRLGG